MSTPVAPPQAAPQQQAGPSPAQVSLGALAVVLAADIPPAAMASLALPLLARLGIAPANALRALALVSSHPIPGLSASIPTARERPQPQPPGPALLRTQMAEPVLRATYLVNAATRLSKGTHTQAQERTYLASHLNAAHNRARAAAEVDQAAAQHGDTLGWKAVMDSVTTPECKAAHGNNFSVFSPPKIGLPGTLHGGTCRCRAVAPFHEGLPVDEVVTQHLHRASGAGDIAFTSVDDPNLWVET